MLELYGGINLLFLAAHHNDIYFNIKLIWFFFLILFQDVVDHKRPQFDSNVSK